MQDPKEVLSTYIGDWDGDKDSTPVWLNGLHATMGVPVWLSGQQFAQSARVYWGVGFDEFIHEWLLHSSDPDQSPIAKGYSLTLPKHWHLLTRGDGYGTNQ